MNNDYTNSSSDSDDFDYTNNINSANNTNGTNDYTVNDVDDENSRPWWDTDEALESLSLDRAMRPDESDAELTKRLLMQAAPQAATSIIAIAMHARSDTARLAAARYIVDLTRDETAASGAAQTWESLISDVVSKAEIFANGSS